MLYLFHPQETNENERNTMGFVLMVRKGNKQQYKTFEADINSELAQNLRDQELAQREEKERVKRLTLNITERFEEEDYQEMMQQQQKPVTQNLNRERKNTNTRKVLLMLILYLDQNVFVENYLWTIWLGYEEFHFDLSMNFGLW